MQPIPMIDDEGCVINLPTQNLIFIVQALKFGTIILKVALATQGLGGIVPDLSSLIPAGMDLNQFKNEY